MKLRKNMWRSGLWMGITLAAVLAVMNDAVARAASSSPVPSSACQWKLIASPSPGNDSNELDGVAAQSANDVWAVGNYQTNGVVQTLVEHWNGSVWRVVASPSPGASFDYLKGIAAVGANDIWAVDQYSQGEVPIVALVEHWNGKSWSVVSVPSPDASDVLNGVAHIPHTNKMWGVGVGNGTLTEAAC